jgi:hypothetical protein
MGGTGLGSCPILGFSISGDEPEIYVIVTGFVFYIVVR